jgi:hypothetical protein
MQASDAEFLCPNVRAALSAKNATINDLGGNFSTVSCSGCHGQMELIFLSAV